MQIFPDLLLLLLLTYIGRRVDAFGLFDARWGFGSKFFLDKKYESVIFFQETYCFFFFISDIKFIKFTTGW